MQHMPKPVTVLYQGAKTNHKCFCFVTLLLNRKKMAIEIYYVCYEVLLIAMQSTSFPCMYQSHIIMKKVILTPFNSCMCCCAKTAIRA